MTVSEIISKTESVCPVCLRTIAAVRVAEADGIYMQKTCPEHGDFRVLLWRGSKEQYLQWNRQESAPASHYSHTRVDKGCPHDCGLCEAHQQQVCCVLLEVTQRCNLQCPVCFASAGAHATKDPSLEEIGAWYDELLKAGGPFNIQLSGGEPTMREDLADIIALGKAKGFTYFQLNTNGLRIARDLAYLQRLVEAGLNNVFLQFDGLTQAPYETLRGRPLLEEKLQAIEHCRQARVGLTLVPTVAPGVNDSQVGQILRFALDHLPHIRGVHFQPVSYFGRCALPRDDQRITIPDMLRWMEEQTDGLVKEADFLGGGAENSYCSFHGNLMKQADGTVRSIKSQSAGCCCASSKQSRDFVAKRWSVAPIVKAQAASCCCGEAAPVQAAEGCCCGEAEPAKATEGCCCGETEPVQTTACCSGTASGEASLFDVFLEQVENYTLAISGMLFQDAWNLDLERVRTCYLCVFSPSMRIIPFCAYNLSSIDGTTLYRGYDHDITAG